VFLQQLPYYAVHLFCSCHSVTRHLLASTGTVLLVSVAYIKSLFCCFLYHSVCMSEVTVCEAQKHK